MAQVAIKICGISTPDTLEAAIAARAEHVGFVFHPASPRFVDTERARKLAERAGARIGRVGLFVNAGDDLLKQVLDAVPLDALQLHGSESPERVAAVRNRFGLPVWKALPVAAHSDLKHSVRYVEAADLVLLDARPPDGSDNPGGHGLAFDWTMLQGWRAPLPWGLAGGLNSGNVAEAIRLTGAELVDTSSGVESAPGIKDCTLIEAFCAAAQQA